MPNPRRMQMATAGSAGGSGELWMWGANGKGELGDGSTTTRSSPVQVGSGTGWKEVIAGRYLTLAIDENNGLWSWGSGSNGTLGHGNTTDLSTPTQIGSLTNWAQVDSSKNNASQSLAVKSDGTLWTWGSNAYGALGLGDTTNRSSPVQVGSLTNWKWVISIGYAGMALKTDGTLWSWGHNSSGQLGHGNTTNTSSPVQIGSATDWVEIGGGKHAALAVNSAGKLYMWGANNGYTMAGDANLSTPTQMGSATDWKSHSSRDDYSLTRRILQGVAIAKDDGTAWVWGNGGWGRLGLGNTTSITGVPTQLGSLTDWSKMGQGSAWGGALKQDGSIWSWGYGGSGRTGHGNTTAISSPVQIGSVTKWTNMSVGYAHGGGIRTA